MRMTGLHLMQKLTFFKTTFVRALMNIFTANEKAADLLLQGSNMEASQYLLKSLSALREEVEATEFDDSTSEDSDMLQDLNELKNELFTVPLPTNKLNNKLMKENDKCSLDYFQSMFCLTLGSSWSMASTEVFAAISAIVMFNAALAFQLEGVSSGKSTLLRKALAIYTKCTFALKESEVDIPLLNLAACSNMAFIHSEFHNLKAVHSTAGELSQMLQGGADGNGKSNLNELDKREVAFFRVQALNCRLSPTRRAPAA